MYASKIRPQDNIKVLSFDLDDTLWSIAPTIKRAEEESWIYMLKHYPSIARTFRPKDVIKLRERVLQQNPQMNHDLSFQRKETLRQLLVGAGYEESAVEELFAVYFKWRNKVNFFSDVRECLKRLVTRYRIIGLTNGNADLKMVGLDEYLETIIYSREIGKPKPHYAMFDALMERAGCETHEIIHIGDHLHDDILGAVKYGIRAVWINRFKEEIPQHFSTDSLAMEIEMIENLYPLCEALNV